ncbi:hypothetical protein LguiA_014853 [Lonicera macranthoides]
MKHNFTSTGAMKPENQKSHYCRDVIPGSELWTDGLICAFEFVRGHKKPIRTKSCMQIKLAHQIDGEKIKKEVHNYEQSDATAQKLNGNNILGDTRDSPESRLDDIHTIERFEGSHWVPIGWDRISELVQTVQADAAWASQQLDIMDGEDDRTVADLAVPYWERPAGPVWWCHVISGNQFIDEWLNNAQWLHPAVSIALRDESRLISERMRYLLYEVPVRVAGGLLFELLGQSVGDPHVDEDDIPVVLRSWQAQNFLITVLHVKGSSSSVNVLGITEVEELLLTGGNNTPKTVHEVIGQLASRLARWDDRLFRNSIFGAADEVELKFINRRNQEDLNLFSIIMNQEIKKLSKQVIRVKWSLHAREEIVFELIQHLRGSATKSLLEGIRKSTRDMIEEQEAVRGRLFTIQDVIQNTLRAWMQEKSLRITHNLTLFGGCGLILSIITGLFGINVDGIPGQDNAPYAFALFSAILFGIGIVLIIIGLVYFGLKKPITEEEVEVRTLELQELVKMFQHEAETHAQVRQSISRHSLPPTSGDKFSSHDADYVIIG